MMRIIDQNVEEILLSDLKECWEKNPTHRCLRLDFTQIDETKEWFNGFVQKLREFIDDRAARLYICQDQDLYLLTRYVTQKRVNEFLAHIPKTFAPVPFKELASLFEISVDWPRLRTLCLKKIEKIELQKSKTETKKAVLAKVDHKKTIQTIDKDLISSLQMRRELREHTEILVVDDDLFSQKMVSNALKGKYSVSMSNDGQGAVMGYAIKAPDVMFLDIGLPDIDGHQVLKEIFKIDPNAYVVMFSGNGDRENVMKALTLGAKGFVAKPFTPDKMLKYIQKSPFIQAKQNRGGQCGNLVS